MNTQGLVIFLKSNSGDLKVKLAGGAAAQCIALMNSIYLEKKLSKRIHLYYFPHSTGTYWPFAIDFLLKPGELGSSEELINGLDVKSEYGGDKKQKYDYEFNTETNKIQFENSFFDTIICTEVIEHLKDFDLIKYFDNKN